MKKTLLASLLVAVVALVTYAASPVNDSKSTLGLSDIKTDSSKTEPAGTNPNASWFVEQVRPDGTIQEYTQIATAVESN